MELSGRGGSEDEIVTFRETYYAPWSALNKHGGIGKELILEQDNHSWVATKICDVQNCGPILGAASTHGGPNGIFYPGSGDSYYNCYVRPIVVLKSNIKIDTSSTDGKTPATAFVIKGD